MEASLGDYKEPIVYLSLARHMADSLDFMPLRIRVMEELMEGNREAGNFREAFNLAIQTQALKDSVLAQDKRDNLNDLDMVYQSEKKDQENESLTTLVSYQLSNLRNQRILILLLAIGSITLAIALTMGYRRNRERNHAYCVLIKKIKDEDEIRKTIPIVPGSPEMELIIADTEKPPSQLMDEIEQYFCKSRPYLDPKLKIEDVSSILNISSRVIAILLKDYKNSNFVSYVNHHRVARSKKLMTETAYQNYKIEAIAIESGFGTRQSFYNAFEDQIGMKPSNYREYISKNKLYAESECVG
jgi:AraC-like DNA-binding protein